MFKLGREGITFKLDYEFRVNIRILAYEAYVQNTRKHRPIFSRSVTIIITFHSACSKGKRFSLPVNFVDTSNLRRDAKFRISSLISLIKSGFLLNLARFPQIPRASLDPKINEWKNAFEAATLGKNLSRFLGFERERGSWTSSAFGRSALSFFFFFFFPFESLIGSGWKFFQNGPQNDSLSKVEKCTRIFYPLLMISRRSPLHGWNIDAPKYCGGEEEKEEGGDEGKDLYGCVEMVFAANGRKKQFSTFLWNSTKY